MYLDGELVNCFLTPHPEDYALLHEYHYAEYLVHYGYLRYARPALALDGARVTDLESLGREFARAREACAAEEQARLEVLEGRDLDAKTLYRTEMFHLQRFVTRSREGENFAGEVIVRNDGDVEYLKLYRPSRAENRRLHLLDTLAAHQWDLERAAHALGQSGKEQMARSLEEADLGYLLNPGLYRPSSR